MLAGHDQYLPEAGKYNAGQKFVFWSQAVLISILFVTGIGLWDSKLPFFEQLTGYDPTMDIRRWAAVIHATAAVLTVVVWIIHVYAAIWVRGTIPAMTQGHGDGRMGMAASPEMAAQAGETAFRNSSRQPIRLAVVSGSSILGLRSTNE